MISAFYAQCCQGLRRLAERLLRRSPIQRHLSGVITGELVDSDLKGSHHQLIFQVPASTCRASAGSAAKRLLEENSGDSGIMCDAPV